jgi:protein TonB
MEGRGWRFGLAGAALLLHVLVLAALPPLGGAGAAVQPVLVRLEPPAPAKPLATPPVATPPELPASPVPAAKPPPASAAKPPLRLAAAPPAPRPQPAPAPPTPVDPAPVKADAAGAAGSTAPSEAVHLAGLGRTGDGPAVEGAGGPAEGGATGAGAPVGKGQGDNAAPAASAEDLRQLLAQYGGSVSGRIRAHQVYPQGEQQAGHEGKVKLSFTLGPDGKLLGVDVDGSSGFSALDSAAVAAVKSAAPFEPIPPALHRSSAKLSITLRFFLK